MTPAGVQPTEYAPIFDWAAPRPQKISLFIFLAASVALHAFCFYLFQIVYPVTVALLPAPARVNLITADSEQGRLLLSWVESEDPALSSITQRPAGSEFLPPVPSHVPSYLHRQPALKELAPYQPDLRIPSAKPPGPVTLPRSPTPLPAGATPSSVNFASEADALGAPQIPPFHFTASINEPPAAAQFRVGISTRGVVRYCFLETSSGDPALDEQARRALLLCRFADKSESALPDDQLLWTTAAFQWGNDLLLPTAASTASPAP